MWNLNGFINDFPLPCRRVWKQFCQVIRIRSVHSLKVCQHSPDVDATLSYSKFETIQLQSEESAEKSNESRKIIFIL